MNNFRKKLFAFKDRLLNFGSEDPLSKLSLIIIIALDIFILTVVFRGLSDHTRQLTSPDEYVPYECKNAFLNKNWSDINFLTKLQPLVLSRHNNYSYRNDGRLDRQKTEEMHGSCSQFYTKVKIISENQKIKKLFIDRQDILKQKGQLTRGLKKNKDVYDTSLLENIADQKRKDSVPTIRDSITSHKTGLEKFTQQLTNTDTILNSEPLIVELKELIKSNDNRQVIVDDYKSFQAFYPLKELGWQLVFMLPLFLGFYFWSSRSVKKDSRVQTLVATHILVVSAIPIIFKIGEVVLDLIPRHFFKNLFNILKSLHIIAIWHYIVILISVCVSLLAVYLIQKKIFNKQRIQQKRLMKGACYSCGKKLPQGAETCPFCGIKQQEKCSNCNKATYVCGCYCKNCGSIRLDDKKV